MKLLLLLLVLPLLVKSQYEHLKLEGSQILFEKVYTLDSLDAASIGKLLAANIPRAKDVSITTINSDLITAKIKDAFIDYKKYGGKFGSTPALMNHPFFADVSIVWKDHRYKVTVSNMLFNTAGFGIMKCSDLFTKKRGTELDTDKIMLKTGTYIEKYLADLFTLTPSKDNW